jgi:hypothetical protein
LMGSQLYKFVSSEAQGEVRGFHAVAKSIAGGAAPNIKPLMLMPPLKDHIKRIGFLLYHSASAGSSGGVNMLFGRDAAVEKLRLLRQKKDNNEVITAKDLEIFVPYYFLLDMDETMYLNARREEVQAERGYEAAKIAERRDAERRAEQKANTNMKMARAMQSKKEQEANTASWFGKGMKAMPVQKKPQAKAAAAEGKKRKRATEDQEISAPGVQVMEVEEEEEEDPFLREDSEREEKKKKKSAARQRRS